MHATRGIITLPLISPSKIGSKNESPTNYALHYQPNSNPVPSPQCCTSLPFKINLIKCAPMKSQYLCLLDVNILVTQVPVMIEIYINNSTIERSLSNPGCNTMSRSLVSPPNFFNKCLETATDCYTMDRSIGICRLDVFLSELKPKAIPVILGVAGS